MRLINLLDLKYDLTSVCIQCGTYIEVKSEQTFHEVLNTIDNRTTHVCGRCTLLPQFEPFYIRSDDLDLHWRVFGNLKRFTFDKTVGCICKRSDCGYIEPPIACCIYCGLLAKGYARNTKHFGAAFAALQRFAKLTKG